MTCTTVKYIAEWTMDYAGPITDIHTVGSYRDVNEAIRCLLFDFKRRFLWPSNMGKSEIDNAMLDIEKNLVEKHKAFYRLGPDNRNGDYLFFEIIEAKPSCDSDSID